MNIRRALLLIICFLFTFYLQAQVSEVWKKSFSSEVLWQEVTSLGNLIVCTQTELNGVDSESGEVVWSKSEFGGIPRDSYQEVSGSPYFTIERGGSVYLLEPFRGETIFNSKKAGVDVIKSYFFLFRANGILIAGEKAESGDPIMLMVDMATGNVTWEMTEKFGRIIAANELSDSEILLVTLFQVYKIDSNTGDISWKNATSSEAEKMETMGAFGNALKAMAENMSEDMEFNIYFYRHPTKDIFYLGAESENTSMSSSTTVTYSNNYTAFNISDGTRVWEQPLEMNGRIGQVAFHHNGLIVLPDGGARTKINQFDYDTQEGKWGKKGRGFGIKGGVYDYVTTDKGLVLVTTNGSNTFLNVLDADAGMMAFEKPVKISGHMVGTIAIPKGILYITTEEVNILDTRTGELLLDKSISTNPALTAEKGDYIYAFDTGSDEVVAINKNAATVKTLSATSVKFGGKEEPMGMELTDLGIFLHSDQNVAMVDYTGKIVYQNYFEAPKESGLKKALLYAQAVRAAYVGANAYYAAGVLQNAAPQLGEEDVVAGAIVQGFGQAYEELGDAAADYTVQAFKQAGQRFKATTEGRDFMIILSQKDKNSALLKISKVTGEEVGYIDLSKDKDPVYCVDDITSQVFQKTAAAEVTSYKF